MPMIRGVDRTNVHAQMNARKCMEGTLPRIAYQPTHQIWKFKTLGRSPTSPAQASSGTDLSRTPQLSGLIKDGCLIHFWESDAEVPLVSDQKWE